MTATRLFVFLGIVVLLGATLAAQRSPADRSTPPAPGPTPVLRVPPVVKRTLSNGIPVWVVEVHEVPVVALSLIVRSGSSADPVGKFGLANLVAALLDEGAGTKTALELADAVDYLGADLSTASSFDASSVRLEVPVARLGDALPLVADVAMRPAFPEKELERIRQERLTALLQARDDPASIIAAAFPRLVFGVTHRYGTTAVGMPETVKALSVDDLKSFHAAHYRPDNAALIVVGDVTTDEVMPLLGKAFGEWKNPQGPKPAVNLAPAPQLKARRVFLIDKPGAAQSQIRIGWIGVSRATPDYFPIEVANTILGGSFTSRLNQNLREEHGYAYGARSGFDMRLTPGPFLAAAGVQTDKTAEALKEFFIELDGMRKPIPIEELNKAKNYVALGFPSEFETTSDISRHLEEVLIYNLPDNYFSTFIPSVQAVTAEGVQSIVGKYIQPDKMAVVVVGDLKVIEAPVKALNLGPVRVVPLAEVMGTP
ncbi:MAG TPA: pitrilysin family protein [Vicinamibacterales bacterium]|jgi:predicted Zn-dependent peptidase